MISPSLLFHLPCPRTPLALILHSFHVHFSSTSTTRRKERDNRIRKLDSRETTTTFLFNLKGWGQNGAKCGKKVKLMNARTTTASSHVKLVRKKKRGPLSRVKRLNLVGSSNGEPVMAVSKRIDTWKAWGGGIYFIRCSINVCSETSSVNIVWAFCGTPPYPPDVWVVDGLSFDRRKRAWEPPASQTINRGSGKRSAISSYIGIYISYISLPPAVG